MNVREKVQVKMNKHQEKLDQAEAKAKAKKAEAKRKKEAENEVSEATSNNEHEGVNEAAAKAQRELEEQQLDALHDKATKASFEDRNEYFFKDGSKVIDHEDGHISIQAGRWSTPEDQAKLTVESAIAKGWGRVSTKGFDEITQSYIEAIGNNLDIEVKTEAEWQKDGLSKDDEQEVDKELDDLEEANVEIDTQEEKVELESLGTNEVSDQEHAHQTLKEHEVEVEA